MPEQRQIQNASVVRIPTAVTSDGTREKIHGKGALDVGLKEQQGF